MKPLHRIVCRVVLVSAMASLLGGCYASASTRPVYAEAYHEPPRVYARPHTTYDGRVVYLVDDRWYFHDGGSWFYYTAEPEPLYRERIVIRERPLVIRERAVIRERPVIRERRVIQQAPPAYERRREHRRRHRYENAPAFPQTAPPAKRVH
jgi:hypothetical protein